MRVVGRLKALWKAIFAESPSPAERWRLESLYEPDDEDDDFWEMWHDLSNEGRKKILRLAGEMLEMQRELEGPDTSEKPPGRC
jgi:hypothetical protein